MKIKFLLFLLSFSILSCNGQKSNAEAVQTLTPKEYAAKLKETPNAQLLDVRTPEEYSSGHLDNAANVNWTGDNFESGAARYDKSKPVFVYCKIGGRSAQAAEKLHQMGFANVYNLEGGILKWNSAGLGKPTAAGGMTLAEFNALTASDKKVLVDFSAEWCAPCKKMKPYLTKMQSEMKDSVKIIMLDADANKMLLEQLKIDELPTLLLYENGKLSWQNKGFIAQQDLKKQL